MRDRQLPSFFNVILAAPRFSLVPQLALCRVDTIRLPLSGDVEHAAIDRPIDCPVADLVRIILQPKPSGDLLRRPLVVQKFIPDQGVQSDVRKQLFSAAFLAALMVPRFRLYWKVLSLAGVSFQLARDGGCAAPSSLPIRRML